MEQYKERLKVSQRVTGIAALILAVFTVIFLLSELGLLHISPITGDSHWHSKWRGFICGAATGIMIMMLINLIRISKALRSETELKKLYIQEHDERQIKIWTAARASAMQVFLIFALVAVVVSGYFNMTVSITILSSALVLSALGLGFKLFYSKKF